MRLLFLGKVLCFLGLGASMFIEASERPPGPGLREEVHG
jgi:hypothetical protein